MKKIVWLFLSAALVLAVCVPALCGEASAIRAKWQYPEGVQLVLPEMNECPQGQAIVRLYNHRDELVSTAALAYGDMAPVNIYENYAFDLLGFVDFSEEMTDNEAYYFEADIMSETIKSGNYFCGKEVPVEGMFEATYSDCFDDRVYIGTKEIAYYYHFIKPSTNGKLQLKSECSAVGAYDIAGGQWLNIYEFVPVEPGEDAVSLKVCAADSKKCLYEVLFTYSIDESLKVSFVDFKVYDYQNALGDTDGSGELTANDASIALALSLDSRLGTRFSSGICDVDGNGIVSANDTAYILQKVLNSDFVYPQEGGKSIEFSSYVSPAEIFNPFFKDTSVSEYPHGEIGVMASEADLDAFCDKYSEMINKDEFIREITSFAGDKPFEDSKLIVLLDTTPNVQYDYIIKKVSVVDATLRVDLRIEKAAVLSSLLTKRFAFLKIPKNVSFDKCEWKVEEYGHYFDSNMEEQLRFERAYTYTEKG